MGVTIHYYGKLNKPELADEICNELIDISKELNWTITKIDGDSYLKKGVIIGPHPNAEPLPLVFDNGGVLKNPFTVEYNRNNKKQLDDSYHSIKTQFAPIEIHVGVIKLLKYLKKKYLNNLTVHDEGSYWETENVKILEEKISFINKKMDEVEGILKEIPIDEHETTESMIVKIEKILKEKLSVKIKKISDI